MTEKEQQNKNTATPSAGVVSAMPIAAPEAQPASPPCNPQVSEGEKWYNRIVYLGINYFANLGISLVTADYFTNLKGRKQLDKVIASTAKAIEHSGAATTPGARNSARIIWETMALTSGGWLATFATKPLEDNKRPLVHWLNKKLGVPQLRPDGTEASADEIYIEKEQPRQGWWNVIKRRLYASAIIIGASHGIDHTIGTKNLTDGVVNGVNNTLGTLPVLNKLPRNATFERYLGFAALDTIFTGVHAATMKVTAGARKADMPGELPGMPANCPPTAAAPAEQPKPQKSFVAALPPKKEPAAQAESHATRARSGNEPGFSLAT